MGVHAADVGPLYFEAQKLPWSRWIREIPGMATAGRRLKILEAWKPVFVPRRAEHELVYRVPGRRHSSVTLETGQLRSAN